MTLLPLLCQSHVPPGDGHVLYEAALSLAPKGLLSSICKTCPCLKTLITRDHNKAKDLKSPRTRLDSAMRKPSVKVWRCIMSCTIHCFVFL